MELAYAFGRGTKGPEERIRESREIIRGPEVRIVVKADQIVT